MRTFAKRLKAARKAAAFRSAQSFAERAGFDPHAYRKYERGEVEPNFETLVRICEMLNIEASDLIPVDIKGAEAEETPKGGTKEPAAA